MRHCDVQQTCCENLGCDKTHGNSRSMELLVLTPRSSPYLHKHHQEVLLGYSTLVSDHYRLSDACRRRAAEPVVSHLRPVLPNGRTTALTVVCRLMSTDRRRSLVVHSVCRGRRQAVQHQQCVHQVLHDEAPPATTSSSNSSHVSTSSSTAATTAATSQHHHQQQQQQQPRLNIIINNNNSHVST